MKKGLAALALVALVVFAVPASAGIITYAGIDPGVGAGGAKPNSDAAAAAFAAATGLTSVIDFESLGVGPLTVPVVVAPGVTASATGDHEFGLPFFTGIEDTDETDLGYNTTPGGDKHLRVTPLFGFGSATISFLFDTPIDAFGAYITGLEGAFVGVVRVTFDDGAVHSLSLLEGLGGGVQFFGFTDFGKAITQVDLIETSAGTTGIGRDLWGIDDVQFSAADTPVPEPSTVVLMGLGLLAVGAMRRRRS